MTVTRPISPVRAIPHDPTVERALIVAALLRAPAVLELAPLVTPDDFYSPANSHTWAAIQALTAAGDHVDAVTVTAALALDGLATDTTLADLTVTVTDSPGTSGIPTYARRLAELAEARRLIHLATELSEIGYSGDLTRAQQVLNDTARDLAERARPSLVLEDVAAVVRGELPDIVPTMLRRTDGQALIYPGLTHSFAGEPASGKTWIALIACLQAVHDGLVACYLDYEGNRRIVGQRLAALGADPAAVADRFVYLRPPALGAAEAHELRRLLDDRRPAVVTVDGVARAIARQGGDEDHAADVLAFIEMICRPCTEVGAAVIMLDHVTKAREGRGRWARGSGSKLGEIEGAAYGIEIGEPFTRTRPGYARMIVAKDREGIVGADGDEAAIVRFAPGRDDRLVVRVEPPEHGSSDVEGAVLAALAETGQVSQKQLIDAVRTLGFTFRDSTIITASLDLAVAGRIRVHKQGAGRATLYAPHPSGGGDHDPSF